MDAAGEHAMDRYDERVGDAEHEAARELIDWWRERPNPDEVARELVTRIREELPGLVDPGRFDERRTPLEILETVIRDQRPEGGRDAYNRIVRRLVDDARVGEPLPVRPWTVQVGDAGFRSNTVGVEARTVDEACRLALEKANADPSGWKNVGDPSDSFIDAIASGRDVDPWNEGWKNVPRKFSQDFVLGGGTVDDDEDPEAAPETGSAAAPKPAPAPARGGPERAAAAGPDDGTRAAPERVWSNGETTIDLDLVRMLDRGESHMPGHFHTVVMWHGATHHTAVKLNDPDRKSLHDAFTAYARHRPAR